MKRTNITDEVYARLVEAFRHEPGNASAAGRLCSVDRRTASKGWLDGWPKQGLLPIKTVIEREMVAARSKLVAKGADERAEQEMEAQRTHQKNEIAVQKDAIQARAEEAATVRAARHNAMGLLAVTQSLLKGANELAKNVQNDIKNAALKPGQAIQLFQQIASTARQANETAKLAIAMERTILGEPDKVIRHEVTMTTDEALREIALAEKAANRHRATVVETIVVVEPAMETANPG